MEWPVFVCFFGRILNRNGALGCYLQTNPKQPDWIHWESKQGLWIESATTPPWARTKLAALSLIQPPPAARTGDEGNRVEIRNRDDDEVTSWDHNLQESENIESMYVLTRTKPFLECASCCTNSDVFHCKSIFL